MIFRSCPIKTQIYYFLIRADSGRLCKDCKVIPNKYFGTQHRLLVFDVEFKCYKWKRESVGEPRVTWWNLTRENDIKLAERISEEGVWKKVEDADTIWEAMAKCIQRSTKEILGISRRWGSKMKGTWW